MNIIILISRVFFKYRNQFDEWTGKDGWTKLNTVQEMVEEWKWK